jgi:hypothetical protein
MTVATAAISRAIDFTAFDLTGFVTSERQGAGCITQIYYASAARGSIAQPRREQPAELKRTPPHLPRGKWGGGIRTVKTPLA